nr:polyphosphate kinase 1 [Leptolyngbya ohadii]
MTPGTPGGGVEIEPQHYFSQELSWLEFHHRVLHEAIDPRTPLLERVKFMAICCSNLDEFFMVRVAALKEQIEAGVTRRSPDGYTPQEQLQVIAQRLRPLVEEQQQQFEQVLRPQLAAQGIYLLDYTDLTLTQQSYLEQYFDDRIFPVLTPLAIDPGHPVPYISNLSLNLAIIVRDNETKEEQFARVRVPEGLPRFILLPPEFLPSEVLSSEILPSEFSPSRREANAPIWTGVPVEQAIAHNLRALFPGMEILAAHLFCVTRDADLELEEDEADDLLEAIEEELRKRRLGGRVVRLEIEASAPDRLKQALMEELELTDLDVYPLEGVMCLRDVMSLTTLPLPELKVSSWTPVTPPSLRQGLERSDRLKRSEKGEERQDIFSILRQRDILLHHPYHSFSASVQQFICQAANDPDVLAIKTTLYRTTEDSPIVNALITAAEKGKQVAVLIELKARFDEENNITWARKLEEAGVHVVYGLVGLKTHTKIILVVRQEAEEIRRYVHIGTGDYNHQTARFYTDLGLLSSREDLGADITDLFNYLTGYSRQQHYRRLLVAPVNLRDRFLALIRREIQHCQQGRPGRIVAQMNALTDPPIINALYEASQAGVQIDLIVRGICCLCPGLREVSDRIRVISIVGRYLEHSRIFYFHNGGKEEIYIGSADWMPRNLDRRIEAVTPIDDPLLMKDLQEILGILLSDNRHAWDLYPNGQYVQRQPRSKHDERDAQTIFMQMAASPLK